MKKVLYIALLLMMVISVPAMAGSYRRSSSSSSECLVGGCHAQRCNGSYYCRDHKCCIYDCKNKCGSDGMYCSKHHSMYYRDMINHYKGKSSSSRKSSSSSRSSSSRKKTIDPDDYDIEAYYEDNWDEYEDYDDAYDGFLDDEDAWDDYK